MTAAEAVEQYRKALNNGNTKEFRQDLAKMAEALEAYASVLGVSNTEAYTRLNRLCL